MEITASTRLLGVIGDPVAHSLSPVMHNAAIEALGLDAVYLAFRCPPGALPELLASLATVGAAGNITVPHKEAAAAAVGRQTDLCARVGACNTFWSESGALVGDNTDVAGVLASLDRLGAGAAGRWLLLGTGGAARAVAVAAAQVSAEVHVLSRDAARAQQFVAWARSRGVTAEPARGALEVDVAINATPLGLKASDPLPLDAERSARLGAALDLVYAPGETPWVRLLHGAGVPAQDGREMLLYQGVAAFTRFFPAATPPTDVMRAALARALGTPHATVA